MSENEELPHKSDIDRVGLSEESRLALDELIADDLFKDSLSCYRMAISLALTKKIDVSDHVVVRPAGHMYLISQLDPDGFLAVAVSELIPNVGKQRYRPLEKLADRGVLMLKEEVQMRGTIIFWE